MAWKNILPDSGAQRSAPIQTQIVSLLKVHSLEDAWKLKGSNPTQAISLISKVNLLLASDRVAMGRWEICILALYAA